MTYSVFCFNLLTQIIRGTNASKQKWQKMRAYQCDTHLEKTYVVFNSLFINIIKCSVRQNSAPRNREPIMTDSQVSQQFHIVFPFVIAIASNITSKIMRDPFWIGMCIPIPQVYLSHQVLKDLLYCTYFQ